MSTPRERILTAAAWLFYRRGIQATGMSELCAKAGVSKRTLYQIFATKDELVAAYLTHMSREVTTNEWALTRTDLEPRTRLLSLFDRPDTTLPWRGCPLHNASVELPDLDHPARQLVRAHKDAFIDQLIRTAREADARDPESLARQLAVLFEGATALSTSRNDPDAFDAARTAAETVIANAT